MWMYSQSAALETGGVFCLISDISFPTKLVHGAEWAWALISRASSEWKQPWVSCMVCWRSPPKSIPLPWQQGLARGARWQWPLWTIFCHHEEQKAVIILLLPSVIGGVEQEKLSSVKELYSGVGGRGFGNQFLADKTETLIFFPRCVAHMSPCECACSMGICHLRLGHGCVWLGACTHRNPCWKPSHDSSKHKEREGRKANYFQSCCLVWFFGLRRSLWNSESKGVRAFGWEVFNIFCAAITSSWVFGYLDQGNTEFLHCKKDELTGFDQVLGLFGSWVGLKCPLCYL